MKYTLVAYCLIVTIAASCEVLDQDPVLRFSRILEGPVATDRASTGGVAWVDYDGDGDLDLFVANGYDASADSLSPQNNRLYRNEGHGKLMAVPSRLDEAGYTSSSAWADFDNDGDEDVFLASLNPEEPNALFRNEGDGQFTFLKDSAITMAKGRSFSASWADIDQDGFLDLFVSNGGLSGTERNFLYRNLGNETFTHITDGPVVSDSIRSRGASWVDYELDGDVDLFVPGTTNALYRNEGDGTFERIGESPLITDPPLLGSPLSSAWGDYDNDGDFDVYVPYQIGEQNRLYRNDGKGRFQRINEGWPVLDGGYSTHSLWADFDQDGYLDLLVVNWGSPLVLYRNLANGAFERKIYGDLGTTIGFASSAAVGDMDEDGDLDIIVGHWPNEPGSGEENLLYRNEGPTGNWLQLDLVGTRSNRSAIGARVVIEVRERGRIGSVTRQTREVRSQDGWRGQNSKTLHFGLGNAPVVEVVNIYWPSGHRQKVMNIPSNQRMTITETSQ